MSLPLACALSLLVALCSAQCETDQTAYESCIQPINVCIARVSVDVPLTKDICGCYFDNNYFDCIDYANCKLQGWAQPQLFDLTYYSCFQTLAEYGDTNWHPDWDHFWYLDYSVFWKPGTLNTTVNWKELYQTFEAEGTIAVSTSITEYKARADLSLFCNGVQSVLRTSCQSQAHETQHDYDCSGVQVTYDLNNFQEDSPSLDVTFYFNAAESVKFTVFAVLAVFAFFMF